MFPSIDRWTGRSRTSPSAKMLSCPSTCKVCLPLDWPLTGSLAAGGHSSKGPAVLNLSRAGSRNSAKRCAGFGSPYWTLLRTRCSSRCRPGCLFIPTLIDREHLGPVHHRDSILLELPHIEVIQKVRVRNQSIIGRDHGDIMKRRHPPDFLVMVETVQGQQ